MFARCRVARDFLVRNGGLFVIRIGDLVTERCVEFRSFNLAKLTSYLSSMPPRAWADEHQWLFLKSKVDAFREAQQQRTVAEFFNTLESEWFAKYPENVALFGPDAPDRSQMTPEQQALHTKALQKRSEVCSVVLDYNTHI